MAVLPVRGDEVDDPLLDGLEGGPGFLEHRRLRVGQGAGHAVSLVRIDTGQAHELAVHEQDGARDLHDRLFVDVRSVRLGLQPGGLARDRLAQFVQARDLERAGDALEVCAQRREPLGVGHAAAHEQVEAVTHATEFLVQRRGDHGDGVVVGADGLRGRGVGGCSEALAQRRETRRIV